ncbi:MAG: hypothetical protein JXQ72_11395 [Anaerolineae bacterium]|nr:hypothetical protein [Anaerolineae bacterium]
MPDQTDPRNLIPQDEIPVEELIRRTREFTRRITNEDRQRLGLDLRESGHSRSLQVQAPVLLQDFFAGKIDLDGDLERRYANAPLLSYSRLSHPSDAPQRRQVTAHFSAQDDSALLTVDLLLGSGPEATVDFTFTLFSALGLRFTLSPLLEVDRKRWLDLMHRRNGITFLWTRDRWEHPFLVFVVREGHGRMYAFSPYGFEAAVRLTPDMLESLRDWLGTLWFPGTYAPPAPDAMPAAPAWDSRPTMMQRLDLPESAPASASGDSDVWSESTGLDNLDDLDSPDDAEADSLSADDLDW